jgi:hypothetical protein
MPRERKIPHFFQIPSLLIASILAVVGFGLAVWLWMAKTPPPRWLEAIPSGLASAAFTLTIIDAFKHRHLSLEHLKVLAMAVAALLAELVMMVGFVVGVVALLLTSC